MLTMDWVSFSGPLLYCYARLGSELACSRRYVSVDLVLSSLSILSVELKQSETLFIFSVIIKGTDVYDSGVGKFVDLSILDVLQVRSFLLDPPF
jgi:hypothetical protein